MNSAPTRDTARHKAALIHLVASIAIVGAVLAVPFLLWYPGALRPLAGIDHHLLLLFAAVLLVGPALTWLVYRTGKRTLRMDITVVVLIQLLFLGYATSMLARLRPVFLVGMEHHMELVRAIDIDREDLATAPSEHLSLSWTGPELVASLPPPGTIFGIDEYARRPAYYIDYAKVGPILAQRGHAAEDLEARGETEAKAVGDAIAALDREASTVRFVPLVSQAGRASMMLDTRDGRPLRAISVSL